MSDETAPDTAPAPRDSLTVSLPETIAPGTTTEQIVDEDLKKFNEWFVSIGQSPISGFEKAAIKMVETDKAAQFSGLEG